MAAGMSVCLRVCVRECLLDCLLDGVPFAWVLACLRACLLVLRQLLDVDIYRALPRMWLLILLPAWCMHARAAMWVCVCVCLCVFVCRVFDIFPRGQDYCHL